ncbi:hypothetical protein FNB15_19155 [Ferrovibrio terrae]|uniref:DUF2059 domain-containing protein n=1 Tax=Ferrovibrio terrae TaxID=2594003 RepID=A0A516H6C2_9PROT|nr:hypothetical protein [Ferrovibrio terrae]QDO99261.1 hypothetical protein FNB15_19155 [Ferrovibrio terrae]
MRRLLFAVVMIVSALAFGLAAGPSLAQAGNAQTRAAAERLMTTIGLEKRVEAITQLYLNFLPTNTPAEQQRAAELRQRGPSAGPRFRTAVVNAASSSYTRPELDALDSYFASGEGQRLLTTAVTRAVLGVGSKGGVKSSDILRPEDLPRDNPALQAAAAKYPAFEKLAQAELQREFSQEIALINQR